MTQKNTRFKTIQQKTCSFIKKNSWFTESSRYITKNSWFIESLNKVAKSPSV